MACNGESQRGTVLLRPGDSLSVVCQHALTTQLFKYCSLVSGLKF